jgi:hypothetical protein
LKKKIALNFEKHYVTSKFTSSGNISASKPQLCNKLTRQAACTIPVFDLTRNILSQSCRSKFAR